jgi:uncharacterized coiled-coil DUF342 family protein
MTVTSTFDRVLEMVETLSSEDQEMLMALVRRRRIQRRRDEMTANIVSTREEFRSGQMKARSVQELMAEFDR